MENVTKGVAIVRENINPNGAYYRVEIENGGESICNITTRNYVRAHANSLLIRDALTTHNTTGKSPSELLEQKEELLEAIKWCWDNCEFQTKSGGERLRNLIKKHQKDV